MSARVSRAITLFEMRGTVRGAGVDGLGGGERRSRVRASLFGPVDHEEVRRTLSTELAEQEKKDRKKYNFDFGAARPVEGGDGSERYLWFRDTSGVPSPYELRRMPYTGSHSEEGGEGACAEAGSAASGPSTAKGESQTAAVGPEAAVPPGAAAAFKQARITDYHQKRKRLLPQGKVSPQVPSSSVDQSLCKKARVQES